MTAKTTGRRILAPALALAAFVTMGTLGAQKAHAVTTYTRYVSIQLQVSGSACTTGKVAGYVTWHDWGTEVSSTQISLANNTGRSVTKDDAWATRGSTPLEHYSRFNGYSFNSGTVLDGIQNDFDTEYTHGKPAYIVFTVHATTREGCARTFSVSSA